MLQHIIRLTPEVSEVVDNLRINIHEATFQELPVNEQRNRVVDFMIRTLLEQVDEPDNLLLELVTHEQ